MSDTLCIVGLGLIGGSLAGALKAARWDGEIVGVVRSERTGQRALELGLVDRIADSLADGVTGADCVLLAVPMLAMRAQLEALQPLIGRDTVITDAGSVKGSFVAEARAVFGSLERIVPGHPIAGRESSGVDAADATLYRGRRVLLTPVEETRPAAIDRVRRLWELAGAEVECLTPSHHDRVLAATSHLPHVLAFALVDVLARRQESEEIFRYAAGGFRDFTRIASSDAIMWRDICLTNGEAIVETLNELEASLATLREAIRTGDSDTIEATFRRARATRDAHVD